MVQSITYDWLSFKNRHNGITLYHLYRTPRHEGLVGRSSISMCSRAYFAPNLGDNWLNNKDDTKCYYCVRLIPKAVRHVMTQRRRMYLP